MVSLTMLLIIWAALTTVLVIVLIYRSTLSMHEDDQLFLDEAESHMELEQQQLRVKMNKVAPVVNWLGAASGALILFIGVMWLWRGISQM
jgi:beta-lactamase regulating signal transducer with metallopeptidase domain